MLENPWPSEAWNTEEMQQVIALGLECNKIDMCSFNLRDRESGLLHRKGTCIATDSPGISETFKEKYSLEDINISHWKARTPIWITVPTSRQVHCGVLQNHCERNPTRFGESAMLRLRC